MVVHEAPVYDRIGIGYDRFRRADPRIAVAIDEALGGARRVVNVGAGTGSYEPRGRFVVAVEPSAEMVCQRPAASASCVRGDAARLPFASGAFDAAMAVLTLHHWADQEAGLRELRRVADGVVILTFDPAVHNSFWLFRDYLPAVAALPSASRVLTIDRVADIVEADDVVPVPVPHDCRDGFGCAYWRRPHAYLDPEVRRCISALGMLAPEDVDPGVDRLRADLASGAWEARYGDLLGQSSYDGGLRLVIRRQR